MADVVKVSDKDRLAEMLAAKDTAEGQYAELITETLKGAGSRVGAKGVLALVEAVGEFVAAAQEFGSTDTVHVQGAHIPTDWVEYPNGRVGLDSVGNISEVVLDDDWEVA